MTKVLMNFVETRI